MFFWCCYSNRQTKIHYKCLCGCFNSVHNARCWIANRLALNLDLRHFICKTAVLQTAAQGTTSKHFYKILANIFLFVPFYLNSSPSAIRLYANWCTILKRWDWGMYCHYVRRVKRLTCKSITGLLFWNELFKKKQQAAALRMEQRAVSMGTYENVPYYSSFNIYLPISTLLRNPK